MTFSREQRGGQGSFVSFSKEKETKDHVTFLSFAFSVPPLLLFSPTPPCFSFSPSGTRGMDEEEKEKFVHFSPPLMLHSLQQERRWKWRLPETCSGRSTATRTLQQTTSPRRRGPGRHARWSGPGAKELAVKVDGAATWPTDAWRRRTTLSAITQQSTRGGVRLCY